MSKTQYIRLGFLWVAVFFLLVFIKRMPMETLITGESFQTFFVYFPLLLALGLMIFRGYMDFSFIGWFSLFSASYYAFSHAESLKFFHILSVVFFIALAVFYGFLLIRFKFPSVMLSVLFIVFSLSLQHFFISGPVPSVEPTFSSSAILEQIRNPSDFKSYLLLFLGVVFMWLAFHVLFRIFQKPAIHKKTENRKASFFLFALYVAAAAIAAILQNKLGLFAQLNPINSAYYTTFNQLAFFLAVLSLAGFSFIGGKSGSLHATPSLIILLLLQQILTAIGLKNIQIALYWLPLMPFVVLALASMFDASWIKRYRMLLSVSSDPLVLEEAD